MALCKRASRGYSLCGSAQQCPICHKEVALIALFQYLVKFTNVGIMVTIVVVVVVVVSCCSCNRNYIIIIYRMHFLLQL